MSCGCHNNSPQTCGLKQWNSILSQPWRPEVENEGDCKATSLLRLGERICSVPLPASGGSRCSMAHDSIAPISASAFTWSWPLLCVLFCLRSPSAFLFLLQAHPHNTRHSRCNTLNLIISTKTLFPKKAAFTGSGDLITFGRHFLVHHSHYQEKTSSAN